MRSTSVCLILVVTALLACKKEESPPAPVATPAVAPEPAKPAEPEEKIGDFKGTYTTNWGKAKCTQVKRNVNCLYAGKSGSMDCKVIGEDVLDCEWEEAGESGKAKLTKKSDGKLVGTWGSGSSATNGGPWIFKPSE